MLEKVHGTEAWRRYLKEEVSPATAKTYIHGLNRFCEKYGITPEDLLSMSISKVVALLTDYAESREKAGSVRPTLFAVKSWLRFNGKPIYTSIPSQKDPLSQDVVRKVIIFAPIRTRVIITLMAYSGLPVSTIGNIRGTDGIRLGDVIDLDIKKLDFERVPAQIVVRKELAKKSYVTFASTKTCRSILFYLQYRKERGELLTEDSPLVERKGGVFINTAYVSLLVSNTIARSRFSFPPKELHEYFRAGLQKAVNSQLVPVEYAEVWMGNKEVEPSALPFDVLEDMRNKFDYMVRLHLEPLR